MKKGIKFVGLLFACLYLTSCATVDAIFKNEKIDIPFDGPMDTRFGYESISWGTTYKKIRNDGVYPVFYWGDSYSGSYYIGRLGKRETSYGTYDTKECYAHGDVEETELFFSKNTGILYMVQDTLSVKNPSLELLHSRYGDFGEENLASKEFKEKGGVTYLNSGLFDNTNRSSLKIDIDANGKTKVIVFDPIGLLTEAYSPKWDKELSAIKTDVWNCWASTDGSAKGVNYTFAQRNADGKWLFLGYHKDLESPARSYVRAGFCWNNNTSGVYEIKKGSDLVTYDFPSSKWYCAMVDVDFTYTSDEYRKILATFLAGEKLTVRHRDFVTEFNPAGLTEILIDKGISADEIDFAIANEEF